MRPIINIPADSPRDFVVNALGALDAHNRAQGPLWAWSDKVPRYASNPLAVSGESKVRGALAALESALESLGSKTGERAEAARSFLNDEIARLRTALTTFESVGHDATGPAAQALIARITDARAATAAAQRAVHHASRTDVLKAHEQLMLVEADGRAVDRDIEALAEALAFPALPDTTVFDRARGETDDLARRIRGKARATALHVALEQGAKADKLAALLWPCFEPKAGHEVFELRAQRYAEAHASNAAP
jgi:hypothetical protein